MSTHGKKEPIVAERHWHLELMLGLIAFFGGFNALLTVSFLPSALQGWGDFRQLYTGGYILRVGERGNFYDYETQLRYEQRLVPIPTHLPVNHLAYEHLLFVPLSLMPYKQAYLIFLGLNIILAGIIIKWLLPIGPNLSQRWRFFVPGVVSAFLPIWRALLQGQDSILLLALLAAAMFALQRRRPLAAGILVGAGLFKFQIVLPIALLFLVWRRWRFAWGFCLSAVIATIVSISMVGKQGMQNYLQMMAGMSVHLKSQTDVVRYATSPLVMLNLRGLITGLFGHHLSHTWVQCVIAASSMGVLVTAWLSIPSTKAGRQGITPITHEFSVAVLAAALVSYHFIEHDASILIIPVVVALNCVSSWPGVGAVAVVIGTLAGLMPAWAFLGALPILALFVIEIASAHCCESRPMGHTLDL